MNIIVVKGPTGGVSVVTSKLYIPSTTNTQINLLLLLLFLDIFGRLASGQYHTFIVNTNI